LSYTAFDPRVIIRSTIGYSKYYPQRDTDISTVSVTNNLGDYIYIPMWLPGEVRSDVLPEMPFIEMKLVSSPASPMNIGANVREQDCYIDFHLYYVNTSNITPTVFGKTVADKVIDLITTNRCTTSTVTFMEVINDGIEYEEYNEDNTTIVFHRVIQIHAKTFFVG
jgi:hypothetical protein